MVVKGSGEKYRNREHAALLLVSGAGAPGVRFDTVMAPTFDGAKPCCREDAPIFLESRLRADVDEVFRRVRRSPCPQSLQHRIRHRLALQSLP